METEQKRIDYEAIAAGASPERKQRIARDQMQKVGYVSLSDALVNRGRDSVIVLQVLDAMNEGGSLPLYKLKILRDQWGKPPVPGEDHEWKWQIRSRDDFGKKLDQSKIHEMVRRGDDSHIIYHRAVIDPDGCITVNYRDAVMLLNNFGVHWDSHMSISKMREHSRDPQNTAAGQQHMWNWRYSEVVPWMSATEAPETAGRTRGRPKKPAAE